MCAARSLAAPFTVGLLASTSTSVYMIVAGLVGLGLAMIATTVWLVRATRRDHVVLGPLERMGDRHWRRQSETERLRELEAARSSTGRHVDPAVASPAVADADAGADEPDDAEPMAEAEPDAMGEADDQAPVDEPSPNGEPAPAVSHDAGGVDASPTAAHDDDPAAIPAHDGDPVATPAHDGDPA